MHPWKVGLLTVSVRTWVYFPQPLYSKASASDMIINTGGVCFHLPSHLKSEFGSLKATPDLSLEEQLRTSSSTPPSPPPVQRIIALSPALQLNQSWPHVNHSCSYYRAERGGHEAERVCVCLCSCLCSCVCHVVYKRIRTSCNAGANAQIIDRIHRCENRVRMSVTRTEIEVRGTEREYRWGRERVQTHTHKYLE